MLRTVYNSNINDDVFVSFVFLIYGVALVIIGFLILIDIGKENIIESVNYGLNNADKRNKKAH